MLNLFSAETAPENNLPDEQIRMVILALRKEGRVQEVIYHTENKESFRYAISTEIVTDTGEQQIQATTSVEKFKLQEDEFLEFVQETLDKGLVQEEKYTVPLREKGDQVCQERLRSIAVKHLRCINKIEKILSTPRPLPVIKKSGARTTFLLFTICIALIGVGLYLLRPLLPDRQSADLTLLFNTANVQVQLDTEQYTTDGNRLDLTLPLGRYRLQTEKPGFKPTHRDIFLTADEEIRISLEELHTLTVYADMEDSRVLLDGNIVGTAGKTTPLKLSLSDGEYHLSLTNPVVSKPFQQKILLQEDRIIRAELPHPRLAVHLNVDDVIITAGEKEYPVKGRELALKLPVGTYRLTARKPGYVPAEQEINIETQDIDLPINLEEIRYRLSVTSNTENSSVSVSCANGRKYSGLASPDKPFRVKIPAQQSCTVLAEKQGYRHISEEVSLAADKELSFALKRLFQVTVYTNLDLSTVMLDGKEAGKAGSKTPASLSIPGGDYLISISSPQAAAPVEQKLRVEKDRRLNIDLPLPKLTVKINQAGAILVVDGKEHRVSGKQLVLELPQGTHHITAKKEGYATLQREVLVRDGAQTFFELLPPVYPLSIRSNIDKTAIYVTCRDGKEYSGIASPHEPFLFKAAAGTCTISASLDGYQEISKPAALPTEKEITLNLIPAEQKKTQQPESKEQPVEQPVVQPEPEKSEPVPMQQPVEQPAELTKTEKDEPVAIEQPTEQPETEKNEPALIEIRPGKVKVKQNAVQQDGKTKNKSARLRSKAEKTKKKKKPVQQRKKKKKAQSVTRSAKQSATEKKKSDPLRLKPEKKDCQYEISIGMPDLCDK